MTHSTLYSKFNENSAVKYGNLRCIVPEWTAASNVNGMSIDIYLKATADFQWKISVCTSKNLSYGSRSSWRVLWWYFLYFFVLLGACCIEKRSMKTLKKKKLTRFSDDQMRARYAILLSTDISVKTVSSQNNTGYVRP